MATLSAKALLALNVGETFEDAQIYPWMIRRENDGNYSVVDANHYYPCHDVADAGVALAVALSAAHLTRVLAARDRTPPPKPDDKEPWLRLAVNIGPK